MNNTSAPLPSFERAEFLDGSHLPAGAAPADECTFCRRGELAEYYRVDGHMACRQCAEHAQSLTPADSHKAYSKAVLYGVVTAVFCCLAYALLEMQGFMIGYVAVGVGWAVAKAMLKGSGGRGGRRYQWTAILLTYAAISIAFVPVMFKAINDSHAKRASTQGAPSTKAAAPAEKKPLSLGSVALVVLLICGIGLSSPFLKFYFSFGMGAFGLFFLAIGMQTAWRMLKRTAIPVDGPFAIETSQPGQAAISA